MNKFFTFLIILYFSFSPLKAEVVNKIEINGNKRISKETIKIYGDIILNEDYSEKNLDNVLKNLYETNFFKNVNVQLNNNVLKIDLEEYPVIDQLIITGEKSNRYVEQIKKIIQLKEKRSYIESYLSSDIEKIKSLYSAMGFNSTNVDVKSKKNSESSFDLLIEIDKGKKTKISSINFIGNKKIRGNRLRDVIASEEDKFWKVLSKNTNLSENLINLDKRLLLNYYKSLGFYDIKINSNLAELNRSQNADLTYSIQEGPRYTINKISTKIDPVYDKSLFFPLNKTYQKYVGEYYSPFKIKKLLEDLDELIEKNSLQFVEHNVEEIVNERSINIVFNVFEGKKNLVERINIKGNTITNESVVRGELILDEGDPFTKLNLDKSIAEIKNRRIFRSVKSKVSEGSKKNLKIIDIEVEEQPTGEISAGAGVGTNGGTIAFGVKENNWMGEGKALSFDVSIDSESLGGELTYSDPNYNFLGNSLYYSLSNESNDKPDQGYENTLISAGVGTSFEQYKDVDLAIGLNASYDDLRTDNTASTALKKQSGTYNELAANYGIAFDRRNRSFKPTSGSLIRFNQSLPIYADKSFIANTFTSSAYKSFSENLIGAGKVYLSTIDGLGSDDVRLSKRKSLSTKRLRGFEKNKIGPIDGTDHIGGNYAAALNFEASLPNLLPEDTNTDLGLFLDFGNVWGVDYDSTLDDSNKIRSSAGIAANWMSPLGPMSFVLSQNISKADTDKTESFNFNLGTTF